jgi:hypothetical protein
MKDELYCTVACLITAYQVLSFTSGAVTLKKFYIEWTSDLMVLLISSCSIGFIAGCCFMHHSQDRLVAISVLPVIFSLLYYGLFQAAKFFKTLTSKRNHSSEEPDTSGLELMFFFINTVLVILTIYYLSSDQLTQIHSLENAFLIPLLFSVITTTNRLKARLITS